MLAGTKCGKTSAYLFCYVIPSCFDDDIPLCSDSYVGAILSFQVSTRKTCR
jgi:hypothetical protein